MSQLSTPPAITPFKGIKIAIPNIEHLDNGTRVVIAPYTQCDVVFVGLQFGGGVVHQPKPLLCHTMLRLLPMGTHDLTAAQIAEQLDFRGSSINMSQQDNFIAIQGQAVTRHAVHLVELLAKIAKGASFPQSEFELVVKNLTERIRLGLTIGNALADSRLEEMLYGEHHPLGHIATLDDAARLTVDDVKEFYGKHFNSSNLTIFVSGNITPQLLDAIRASFSGNWGSELQPLRQVPIVKSENPSLEIIDRDHLVQSSIAGALITPMRNHPDYYTLRCAVKLLGGYFGSRLSKNIREDKGYTYGITAELLGHRDLAYVSISTECNIEYTHNVIDEIRKEIDGFASCPVTEQETDMLKNNMLKRLATFVENPLTFGKYMLTLQEIEEGLDYVNRQVDNINALTPDALNVVACKHLDASKLYFAIATNKKELKS